MEVGVVAMFVVPVLATSVVEGVLEDAVIKVARPRKFGFLVAESKDLPPALECCSSSERCKSLDCLMLCLLKPKEKG